MYKIFLTLLFICFGHIVPSQNKNRIDSLMLELKVTKSDTAKIDLLLELSWELKEVDPVESRKFSNEALRSSIKINDQKRTPRAYMNIAITCNIRNDLDSALYFNHKAVALFELSESERALAKAFSNLGSTWLNKRNFDSAEFYFNKAVLISKQAGLEKDYASALFSIGRVKLESNQIGEAAKIMLEAATIMERNKDSLGLGGLYNSVGVAYFRLNNFKKTLQYWNLSLQIKLNLHLSPFEIAMQHANLAAAYKENAQVPEATEQLQKALAIAVKFKQNSFIADVYINMGLLHRDDLKPDSSLKYLGMAVQLKEEAGDKKSLASAYVNYAGILGKSGDVNKALIYLEKAQRIFESGAVKNPPLSTLSDLYSDLSSAYKEKKDFQKAFMYHVKLKTVNDSMWSKESQKSMNELEGKYQNEKKGLEIAKLESEKKTKDAELATEKTVIYSLVGGLLLVILFSFYVYSRFRIIRKQKHIIEKQHQLTQHQKEIIVEKQKEIIDSINYARRIQMAQIPSETLVAKKLKKLMRY